MVVRKKYKYRVEIYKLMLVGEIWAILTKKTTFARINKKFLLRYFEKVIMKALRLAKFAMR